MLITLFGTVLEDGSKISGHLESGKVIVLNVPRLDKLVNFSTIGAFIGLSA